MADKSITLAELAELMTRLGMAMTPTNIRMVLISELDWTPEEADNARIVLEGKS